MKSEIIFGFIFLSVASLILMSEAMAMIASSSDFVLESNLLHTSDDLDSARFTVEESSYFIPVYGDSADFQLVTVASALCGNGVKEVGEICDGSDFGDVSCQSLGYTGGLLTCENSCSALNPVLCTSRSSGGGGGGSYRRDNVYRGISRGRHMYLAAEGEALKKLSAPRKRFLFKSKPEPSGIETNAFNERPPEDEYLEIESIPVGMLSFDPRKTQKFIPSPRLVQKKKLDKDTLLAGVSGEQVLSASKKVLKIRDQYTKVPEEVMDFLMNDNLFLKESLTKDALNQSLLFETSLRGLNQQPHKIVLREIREFFYFLVKKGLCIVPNDRRGVISDKINEFFDVPYCRFLTRFIFQIPLFHNK